MNIEIFQEGDKDHQDSVWYDGDVALLSEGDRIVLVMAVGDIRIRNTEGDLVFDGKERGDGIEGGFESDKDLKKIGQNYDDKYYWDNNNWFELLHRRKGKQWNDIMGDVCHTYDEAIEAAKIRLKDDEFWKEVE